MLDLAVLRRPGIRNGVYDIGRILDALLYYGRVHLIVDYANFIGLWSALGKGNFQALLSHERVTADVTPEFAGVHNEYVGHYRHKTVFGQMVGRQEEVFPERDYIGTFLHGLRNNAELFGNVKRRDVEKVLRKARPTRYNKILRSQDLSDQIFQSLATDSDTLRLFLENWAYSRGAVLDYDLFSIAEFSIEVTDGGVIVNSNVPVQVLVRDTQEECSWGAILADINEYGIDLQLSELYSADIITRPENENIAALRVDLSIVRALGNQGQISAFEKFTLGEGVSLGTAYDEGRISFPDALKLIDRTAKFREWVDGLSPTADLLSEYHSALVAEFPIRDTAQKISRFALFTAAGLGADAIFGTGGAATAASVGLNAVDAFVVDYMLRGWRPSMFVSKVKRAVQ